MKQYIKRITRLVFGNLLFVVGIVLTLEADVGYAPWDVFNAGISLRFGISFGMAAILSSAAFLIIVWRLGETIGLGAVLNTVMIGACVDVLMAAEIIPHAEGLAWGVGQVFAGMLVVSLASFFYIGSGFGSGPRDSLMVAMVRITRLPVGVCRTTVELTALLIGWMLGGMAGVGTVIIMLSIGVCIQITFSLLKFRPQDVEHESIVETYNAVKALFRAGSAGKDTPAPETACFQAESPPHDD